jgi:hypothetical protein
VKISQREVRRLKKRVYELEDVLFRQREAFASEWPSYTKIATFEPDANLLAKITTARLLKHAVVLVPDGSLVRVLASELPKP